MTISNAEGDTINAVCIIKQFIFYHSFVGQMYRWMEFLCKDPNLVTNSNIGHLSSCCLMCSSQHSIYNYSKSSVCFIVGNSQGRTI